MSSLARCTRVPVSRPGRRSTPVAVALVLAGTAWLAGCRPTPGTVAPPSAAPTPAGLLAGYPHVRPPTDDRSVLTLWTVPDLAEWSAEGTPLPLGEVLDAYRGTHPELHVRTLVKPAYGPAGIDAYLVSSAEVVPSLLPDVAIVPIETLTDVIAAGLAAPLPDDFPLERVDGAFPFAAARGRDGDADVPVAVPFAVDMVHVIARAGAAPSTWRDIARSGPLIVPSGGYGVPALAADLSFYAAAGGPLVNLPKVEPGALANTLALLGDGVRAGTLRPVDVGAAPRATWNAFLRGEEPLAIVSAGVFVSQQANFPALSWGSLPGPDGPAPTVAWGWALVVTARAEENRARAADLVTYLTDPDRRGWVVGSGLVPAWPDGWEATVASASAPPPTAAYAGFVRDALTRARTADGPQGWAARWSDAVAAVLAGGSADAAATRIAPGRE